MLEVVLRGRQLVLPEAAVLDVALELVRVDRPAPVLIPLLAAPAGQRADAGRTLVVDDVVGIAAGAFRTAVFLRQARQAEPGAQDDQQIRRGTHGPYRRAGAGRGGIGWGGWRS